MGERFPSTTPTSAEINRQIEATLERQQAPDAFDSPQRRRLVVLGDQPRQPEVVTATPEAPEPDTLDQAVDRMYGPGSAAELKATGGRPSDLRREATVTHALTGERLLIHDALNQEVQGEALGVAHIVESLEQQGGDTVRIATAELAGETVVVEAVQLDPDHGVEVTYDTEGGLKDVVVFASETTPDGGTEEHTVEITPDTAHPEAPQPEITIDGHPVTTEEEVAIAEAVMEHTGEQLEALAAPEVAAEPDVEPSMEDTAPEEKAAEASPEPPAKAAPASERPARTPQEQARRRAIGETAQYVMRGVPERVLQQVAAEAGVDMKDFRGRLSTGEITLDPESMKALHELQQNGLKPGSPEWNTDPRNPSALGQVSRQSRELLGNLIRNAAR